MIYVCPSRSASYPHDGYLPVLPLPGRVHPECLDGLPWRKSKWNRGASNRLSCSTNWGYHEPRINIYILTKMKQSNIYINMHTRDILYPSALESGNTPKSTGTKRKQTKKHIQTYLPSIFITRL